MLRLPNTKDICLDVTGSVHRYSIHTTIYSLNISKICFSSENIQLPLTGKLH